LAVFDVGQQDGSPYIVSELLEGESLRSRLRTSSAESEEGRLRIKENAGPSNTCPTQSGEACVSQGLTGVRTSGLLCFGRYSSKIRTGCANERPSGSVRGAPGNWCPYPDRQQTIIVLGQRRGPDQTASLFSSRSFTA
jgi:hypothetical protein